MCWFKKIFYCSKYIQVEHTIQQQLTTIVLSPLVEIFYIRKQYINRLRDDDDDDDDDICRVCQSINKGINFLVSVIHKPTALSISTFKVKLELMFPKSIGFMSCLKQHLNDKDVQILNFC